MLDFFDKNLDKILPLLGVVLGAFLSPLVSHFLERNKRKQNLKSELIEELSALFGMNKDHFIVINEQAFLNRYIILISSQLSGEKNESDRDYLKFEINRVLQRMQNLNERFKDSYSTLVAIESRIQSLIFETRDIYGKDVFRSVNSLLQPVIRESNDNEKAYLHDYQNLEKEALDAVQLVLSTQIASKLNDYNKQQELVFKELSSCF
jgi:hypothetical protein